MALVTKPRFNRLVRQLTDLMERKRARPASVIGSALALWCDRAFPGLPPSDLPSNATLQNEAAVCALVDFVVGSDLLEATYWFASAYAHLAGDDRRKQLAMYFTPPSLTRRLLDDLARGGVDFGERTFCDPACGGAAFLVPLAQRMRDALRCRGANAAEILEHVQEHLLGFDRDAALCAMSKHFLLMALHAEISASNFIPDFRVTHADSLALPDRIYGTFDVVVCNPPYRKMPTSEAAAYSNAFSDVVEAQPNLYALFIALCVRLLALGGTCALVTPTSFLSGQYFTKLRRYLARETDLQSIGMVSDRLGVFIDVQQETALTVLRRKSAALPPLPATSVAVVSRSGDYVDVGSCSIPDSGEAWTVPRTVSDVELIRLAAQSVATLKTYGYRARIGAFVWNRDTRTTYPSEKSAARSKGRTALPLLWSSDIAPNGKLRFTGSPKPNGEHCFVNLGALNHPSVVRNPSVVLQRVTSNAQPRRLVAAPVPSFIFNRFGGFVGENHTVVLEQMTTAAPVSPSELAELLTTPTVDRCFRCISGATNVSVFELEQLRLPDPTRLKKHLSTGKPMALAAQLAIAEGTSG